MASEYTIGVDLGGTSVKVGLTDFRGNIIHKECLPTFAEKGPDQVISQISDCIRLVLDNNPVEVEGIGIGSPGAVIASKGTVDYPPNFPGWESIALGKIISESFSMPAYVENDANAAAIGELIFGAGKDLDSFIMITLGTGVGGGIIFERKIFHGTTGAAGELGHISVDYQGRKCKCGNYGCMEAYAGNNYLVEWVEEDLQKHINSLLFKWVHIENEVLTPKLIHEAAMKNDDFAIKMIIRLAQVLGYGISSIINASDIPNVVIGGGVAGFGEFLFKPLNDTIIERVMKTHKSRVTLRPAVLKNEAGILGASALVLYQG